MSKKRKTRKEKMRVEERRSASYSDNSSVPVYTFDSTHVNKNISLPPVVSIQHSYAYVISDVKKTLIITSVLSAISIILFFFIQNHIIRLSIFGF